MVPFIDNDWAGSAIRHGGADYDAIQSLPSGLSGFGQLEGGDSFESFDPTSLTR
jgi:hypothetical protein